ncbi:MAG: D-alanyl-D-alanine carboxypeptidase, partial [Clostridia bacterium]|nr:D-alanyl-D-alanine carboxypeptidase [Clostridia bacterium]
MKTYRFFNNLHIFKKLYKPTILLFLIFTCTNLIFASEIPRLNSTSAVLVDSNSDKSLFEKNGDKKIYPASTTKILTAILALENLNLDSSVVVSKTALDIPWDSSNAALKKGEVISVKDLLYSLMLKSGNDSANVVAEAVSGTIDEFIVLMNNKLEELGCNNTNFTNAHGYHDEEHYSTAKDMVKILSYAVKNDDFVKICSTSKYTIPPTNKTPVERVYQNTNRLILSKSESYLSRHYEFCVGGKTGFTNEAGRTLVTFGKKDDKFLLVGIFGGNGNSGEDTRYTDAINLFNYGFDNFTRIKVLDNNNYNFSYIDHKDNKSYSLSLKNNFDTLIPNDDLGFVNSIKYSIVLNENNDISRANIGQAVGTFNVSIRQNSSTFHNSLNLITSDITSYRPPSSIFSSLIWYLLTMIS